MVAQEGRYFFSGNQPGREIQRERTENQLGTKDFLGPHAMAAPVLKRGRLHEPQQAELQGRSSLERPALSGDWIQSEALRAIKSNASPACSCFPEARIRAPDLSESEGQRGQGTISEGKGNQDSPRKSRT